MKKRSRILAFILAILPILSSCASHLVPETLEVPKSFGSAEREEALREKEDRVKKIIVVGNSHSNDAFMLLYEVFRAYSPEQEIVLGIMYYSRCSISNHVKFALGEEKVYRYYKNENGKWITKDSCSLRIGLRDQQWDVVMLQAGRPDLNDTMNLAKRRQLEAFINENVPTPHTFAWHTSWPSPNDERLFTTEYGVNPPAGWKEDLIRLYGFDPVTQFSVSVERVKKTVLLDETYDGVYCTGAGIMYAHLVMGSPQIDLWRDYTHLSDFGRLIASHSLYVQMTGKPLSEVKIDVIPAELRQARFRHLGDLMVTDEMKEIILKSANHSLEEPWSVPTKP